MKKTISRILSVLLCACLLACVMPITSFAWSFSDDSGSWSTHNASGKWSYKSKTSLTISLSSGDGRMDNYETRSDQPWDGKQYIASKVKTYYYRDYCDTIYVESGITYIGDRAFRSWSASSVSIADTVTEIGSYSFSDMTSLTSFTSSSIEYVRTYAFYGDTALKTVSLTGVALIDEYAFAGCTALTTLILSNDCQSIADTAFYNVDTSQLTVYCPSGSYAASYCDTNGITWVDNTADVEPTPTVTFSGAYDSSTGYYVVTATTSEIESLQAVTFTVTSDLTYVSSESADADAYYFTASNSSSVTKAAVITYYDITDSGSDDLAVFYFKAACSGTVTISDVSISAGGETWTDSDAATTLSVGHLNLTSVDAVAATCTTTGNIAYYYCTVCKNYYSDADGTTKISKSSTVVAATSHTAGDAVIENEVEATCDTDGSYDTVYYCTVCGTEISRETTTIAATGHTAGDAVIENSVEATCDTDGSYDTVYYCTVCGEEISRETTTISATGHSYVGEITTVATCTEDGVRTYTCSVCGATKTETISALGHSMTYVAATEATATEAGNTAYYYCSTCGLYFADADGTEQITLASTIIPATGELSLTDDSAYVLDDENAVVYVTDAAATGVTADEFAANFAVEVPVSGEDILSSGYTFTFADTTYTVVILGDVDMNGTITMSDARAALRLALSVATAEEQEGYNEPAADLDFSGEASLSEARAILRYALSLDTALSA